MHQPKKEKIMTTYPFLWTDNLGPLPAPLIRMRLQNDYYNELFLKNFMGGEWIAIARRQNRKWLPLFSDILTKKRAVA
jgi:hypothetical protein